MRCDDNRGSIPAPHFSQDVQQSQSLREIKAGKGLVKQQYFRLWSDHCRKGYAVLFPEAERKRCPVGKMSDSAKVERFRHNPRCFQG